MGSSGVKKQIWLFLEYPIRENRISMNRFTDWWLGMSVTIDPYLYETLRELLFWWLLIKIETNIDIKTAEKVIKTQRNITEKNW